MCVLADCAFSGVNLDGIKVQIFPPQSGWADLARLIRRRVVDVTHFHWLYIALGRADVDDDIADVPAVLRDLSDSIYRFNSSVKVIIAGPIPRGADSRRTVARCVNAGKIVQSFCSLQNQFSFTKVATQFYSRKGVNTLFMLPGGSSSLGKAVLKANVRVMCV